jgi:hypothetical protein
MTMQSISDQKRDFERPVRAQSASEEAAERLAGLLPEEALEDALRGLRRDEITGPGGPLSQLAGRVIETALGALLVPSADPPHELVDAVVKPGRLAALAAAASHEHSVDLSDELWVY